MTPPVRTLLLLLLPLPTAVLLAVPAAALDNGLALVPPRGFRTWNQFGIEVNQSMMSDIIRAMAQRRPPPSGGGAPLSLVDLGYTHAGVDDGWQLCGSGAAGGFHNASGYPNIDPAKVRALLSCARQAALGRSVSSQCVACFAVPRPALDDAARHFPRHLGRLVRQQLPLRGPQRHVQGRARRRVHQRRRGRGCRARL